MESGTTTASMAAALEGVVQRPCGVRRMKRSVGLAFRTKAVQCVDAATITGSLCMTGVSA